MAAVYGYGENVRKQIPDDCLKRYFISENAKRTISWRPHDLTGEAPTKDSSNIIFL